MNSRKSKLALLDQAFNEGSKDSLKELIRPMYPIILIFRTNGDVMNLSPRLNPTLPEKYTNRNLSDKELDTILVAGGNGITFLLPDNGRD